MALKEHRILMVGLLKKEIASNGWLTACSSEQVDNLCQTVVRLNCDVFDTMALAYIAKAIKKYSRTSDSAVEIADKLVNKCCRVLLVNDDDGSRWDGR